MQLGQFSQFSGKLPQKVSHWVLALVLVSGLWLGSCSGNSAVTPSPTAVAPESPATPAAVSPIPAATTAADIPAAYAGLPRLNGSATVELVVKGTPITLQINGNDAPITAGNFVDLVNRGVYNGLMFHRVVRQPQPFVVQGGDPQSKDTAIPAAQLGTGGFVDPATGAPRDIPLEIKPAGVDRPLYSTVLDPSTQTPVLKHTRGAVAMARSQLPDSASSQFYIALSDLGFLDGQYAVFGYVDSGMETVDQIQQGDRIESARVVSGIENLQGGGQ